jgi:hypothetical protein
MAYIARNLGPAGSLGTPIQNGTAETVPGVPRLWMYRTADAATTVDTTGYFNDAARVLSVGDAILRITIDGSGVPATCGIHVVQTISAAGVVNVTDALALNATNTD